MPSNTRPFAGRDNRVGSGTARWPGGLRPMSSVTRQNQSGVSAPAGGQESGSWPGYTPLPDGMPSSDDPQSTPTPAPNTGMLITSGASQVPATQQIAQNASAFLVASLPQTLVDETAVTFSMTPKYRGQLNRFAKVRSLLCSSFINSL